MSTPDFAAIRLGDQVFTAEGADPVGAVRELRGGAHPAVIVYIENSGDVVIPSARSTRSTTASWSSIRSGWNRASAGHWATRGTARFRAGEKTGEPRP